MMEASKMDTNNSTIYLPSSRLGALHLGAHFGVTSRFWCMFCEA